MADLPREPSDQETYSARRERQLIQYVRSITPRSSNTCRVRRTTGGITLQPTAKSTKQSSSGATTPAKYHPFQIIDTSTTTVPRVQVYDGTLIPIFEAAGIVTIGNLSTDITVTVDSLIYLYYDDTSGNVTITAESLASRSTWTSYPGQVTVTGSGFTSAIDKWFALIGYVSTTVPSDPDTCPGTEISINGTDHFAYQCLFTNLMLQDMCYNGTPIQYPYPWQRSGPVI